MTLAARDRIGCQRQLQRTGHANDIECIFGHAVREHGRAGAINQRIGDARIPATGEDGVAGAG